MRGLWKGNYQRRIYDCSACALVVGPLVMSPRDFISFYSRERGKKNVKSKYYADFNKAITRGSFEMHKLWHFQSPPSCDESDCDGKLIGFQWKIIQQFCVGRKCDSNSVALRIVLCWMEANTISAYGQTFMERTHILDVRLFADRS